MAHDTRKDTNTRTSEHNVCWPELTCPPPASKCSSVVLLLDSSSLTSAVERDSTVYCRLPWTQAYPLFSCPYGVSSGGRAYTETCTMGGTPAAERFQLAARGESEPVATRSPVGGSAG